MAKSKKSRPEPPPPSIRTAAPPSLAGRSDTAHGVTGRFDGKADGESLETLSNALLAAVVLPDGDAAIEQLGIDGRVLEFVKDQHRHCKPILAIGSATGLLQRAGIPETLVSGHSDPGVLLMDADDPAGVDAFIAAIAKHRHFDRETDPPRV